MFYIKKDLLNSFEYLNDFSKDELIEHIDYLQMIICRQMFNKQEYYEKAIYELNKSIELLNKKEFENL